MTQLSGHPCAEWRLMLHGYVDCELDAANALRFEQHLGGCPRCAAELSRVTAVKQAIAQDQVRWPASAALRERVAATIAREGAAPRSAPAQIGPSLSSRILYFMRQWSLVPSLAALAAGLFLMLSLPQTGMMLPDELIAGHVRSLLANHLTDIETSDRHTVKPWFTGKIDFSPPVVDLAARGFPLVGGRVDYIGGRVVAALVYRRNRHLINVFIWPSTAATTATIERDGYNLINWTQAELSFWLVSDLNAAELRDFKDIFAEEASK